MPRERKAAIGDMPRLATQVQRLMLMVIQDGRCALCGSDLPDAFEADHIIPFSEGGRTELWNLQALCISCHSEKTLAQAKEKHLKRLLSIESD